MTPERLGYWRIVGLTQEGETIQLIRDRSPFFCWMHLADDARNRWRESDWEWLAALALQYLWPNGWGQPRRATDSRLWRITMDEWRWVIRQGLAFRIDAPIVAENSSDARRRHKRFVQEQTTRTLPGPDTPET